ncbi:isochorismatase [Burkholderia pseudomallei]|nr:isochorismatase [Burkholderia pseudomallei]
MARRAHATDLTGVRAPAATSVAGSAASTPTPMPMPMSVQVSMPAAGANG